MIDALRLRAGPLVCGLLAVALLALALPGRLAAWDEAAGDLLLRWGAPRPAGESRIAVIDIDSASLAAVGPWPWRRALIAGLVARAIDGGARAVGIDILFAGAEKASPAALARRLGEMTGNPAIAALAPTLDDDDRTLAATLAGRPVVLGFLFAGTEGPLPPGAALLRRGRLETAALWQAPGAEGPFAPLAQAAAGTGLLALPGDDDGLTRRAPLFAVVGGEWRAGLALETLRVAEGSALYRLEAMGRRFATGRIAGQFDPGGWLRLVPTDALPAPRVIPAHDLLGDGTADFRDMIVFIGGSAPELGGLRPTAAGPLTPSVMIQAGAAAQLLQAYTPQVPALWPVLAPAGLVLLALLAALALPPLAGSVGLILAGAGLVGLALLGAGQGLLLPPASALILGAAGYIAAAIPLIARQQRREQRIRRRFEQHLAPAVVARIARNPQLLKLGGERRTVTALFTDIADFTRLAHDAGPEELVALLDGYFEGMSRIVMAHGGMVDKFVGDALHALFNAPLDQADHAVAAVQCARALDRWCEAHRQSGLAARLGLGATRIGVETGAVIVGDIGLQAKLDYTAHGDAVNAASRLEAANKTLGTRICIGPGTAALCPPGLLRQSGHLALRGLAGQITTYEPSCDGGYGNLPPAMP